MNLKKLFNFGQFKSKLTTIGAKELYIEYS